MCGRYSFVPTKEQLDAELSDVDLPAQLRIQYNIAPTNMAYVIANDKPHKIQEMIWGLVPSWSKDGQPNGKLINARAESITEKPSFKDPIRRRRCLVPADSFYEWRTQAGNRKTPYRIQSTDGSLLMMAGIWDEWGPRHMRTFSILTTSPNAEMSALHNRMPVLLNKEEQKAWLSVAPLESILPLLKTAPDNSLQYYRVSEKLNRVGTDGPELHREEKDPPSLFDLV
jgi:putative SOS response-associated peptidase YedK